MAQVVSIERFEKNRGHHSIYPWSQWLDGQPWELTRGEDFRISIHSFRTMAARAARQKGGRIRSCVVDGKLIVMFVIEE